MESSEIRRKRKRTVRSLWSNYHHFFSARSLFLCFSFFLFFFIISSSNRFSFFHFHTPNLSPPSLSLFYKNSATYSVLHSLNFNHTFLHLPFTPQHLILFPDHLLLIVAGGEIPQRNELDCIYKKIENFSDEVHNNNSVLSLPVISTDGYSNFRSIIRCPIPPANFSTSAVYSRRRGGGEVGDRSRSLDFPANLTEIHYWSNLVYEAYLDGDTVVVFVKGLNLRPHQISDPTRFQCHFGLKNGEFILKTKAISAAQEVVRCSLPRSISNNPNKVLGFWVTVSRNSGQSKKLSINKLMPSVATIQNRVMMMKKKKHELCACTMVWNQASAMKEWIMYHSWLGVERWFIYDNNSDDDIESVIGELSLGGYNVSRTTWPWIKTQEAGFSHCALRSKEECNWVGFFDVDEFFYLKKRGSYNQNALKSLVSNFSNSSSSSSKIAEIRTACHNFGPSGLTSEPKRGVITEYTCRMKNAERHKSIVKPEMLHTSLLNVVHHFELQEGMRSVQVKEREVVINHYKYQVWERFKDKFLRRVATYVVDWHEDKNKSSKDRAPGLGTEAIEPPNWRLRFCEVWDTGLKDFVLSHFAHPETGTLPWEKASQVQ